MKRAKGELKLVFPSEEYKEKVEDFLKEHFENKEFDIPGDGELDYLKDFDKWLQKVRNDLSEETVGEGRVPATVFLAIRQPDDKLIGIIQIRHKLNEYLLNYGGHIGDDIRPSERGKGYGTEMIALALEKCKMLGIKKVLMVCNKDNEASRRSIIKNGGILENEVLGEGGQLEQRYWINLKEEKEK